MYLEKAFGINTNGQIVGEGPHSSVSTPHAFLLSPTSSKVVTVLHTTTSKLIMASSRTTTPSAPAVSSTPNSEPAGRHIQVPLVNNHVVSMQSGNLVAVDRVFAAPGQATSSGPRYDDLLGLWSPAQELSVAH
jgi:probable HAF family extracellular repeat protein